jgi:hypothetical protein
MPEIAIIKNSPEYVMGGTAPPPEIVLCPQCKGGRVHASNETCPRCGYHGPGHTYTLADAVTVVVRGR